MASDGPQPPPEHNATRLSEVDLLRIQLSAERRRRVIAEMATLAAAEQEVRATISAKYALTPSDQVNGETGEITRSASSVGK